MKGHGFTLMEVLITLSIISLIAIVTSSSIMFGVRARDSGEAKIKNLQGLRTIVTMLSQQLKSVYPYKMVSDDKKVVAFKGRHDAIWFACATGNSSHTVKWVSYYVENGSLMINQGLLPDKKFLEKVNKDGESLDCGVNKIDFKYLTDEDSWDDSWELSSSLPKAVSVKINEMEPFKIFIPVWVKQEKAADGTKLPELVIHK